MSHTFSGTLFSKREMYAVSEAVKASDSRWRYVHHNPTGTFSFSVDINNADVFYGVYKFYTTHIVEKTRKYSIFHKIKVWFKKKFN